MTMLEDGGCTEYVSRAAVSPSHLFGLYASKSTSFSTGSTSVEPVERIDPVDGCGFADVASCDSMD